MGETARDAALPGAERLEEAAALFTLLGRIFHGVPDRELVAAAVDGHAFDEVPFAEGDEAEEGRRLLAAWGDACGSPFSEDDFHRLSAEYTRLFVGTRKVVAPMWESVYFNKDRMVFQGQTFEVRRAYARYGLEVDALAHEPDDHLAYELLFVARLAGLAAERLRVGDADEARVILADMASFAVCHPLTWVSAWRDKVLQAAREDFYRGYAILVCAALRQVERELAPVVVGEAAA